MSSSSFTLMPRCCGWTGYAYGPNVKAIKALSQSHNGPHQEANVIKWFGLIQTGGTISLPVSTTPSPKCGGIGWTGGTTCASGSTCTKINDWHFQGL
ncbi:hypothetical protein EV426DRAFT_710798 [Tirmania nivea]|nr:hypothetical protein EV426DRAFT_710798 [Tirmania nivea]